MDDELRTFLMNRNLAEELIAKLENENVRHYTIYTKVAALSKNKPTHT